VNKALLAVLKNPSKSPKSDPEADDFQTSIRYICGKTFTKIRSVILTWSC